MSHDNFYLRDGSPNDGYFLKDKIHLTPQGTNCLLKDLKLDGKVVYSRRTATQPKDVTQPRPQAQQRKTDEARLRPAADREPRNQRPSWTRHDPEHRHQPSRNYQHRSADIKVRCYFCGEDGHISDVCFHGKPIECDECGVSGHKKRWCHLY